MPNPRPSAQARGYTSKWQKARAQYLKFHPLCGMCARQGHRTAATVVDHIKPHKGDQQLFWSQGNWQSLCVHCHSATKQRIDAKGYDDTLIDSTGWPVNRPLKELAISRAELLMPTNIKPSAIPLTIVCGPPGSGKSTYVREHAGPDDLVIDLDQIMSALAGKPEHTVQGTDYLDQALAERNRMLRALANNTTHPKAWFIVTASGRAKRVAWRERLGGEVLILKTPLAECIRRIKADPARTVNAPRMIAAATRWWELEKPQHTKQLYDYGNKVRY